MLLKHPDDEALAAGIVRLTAEKEEREVGCRSFSLSLRVCV
jgi:hypothetical protein